MVGTSQTISLRTVPIATGEQYVVLPSETFGMGGVGIAMRDALSDPFSNPALGSRLSGTRAFAAPTFYNISGEGGGGRTLTTGLLGRSGRVFGGIALSLQELDNQPTQRFIFAADATPEMTTSSYLSNNNGNRYVHAVGGARLGDRKTSIGAGLFHASLHSVDGMRQLYANSVGVTQDGGITDYKIGVVHEMRRGWVEASAIHSRVDITQDVDYQTWTWPVPVPPWQDPVEPGGMPTFRSWTEQNHDVSRTNGLRTAYVHELNDAPGWRIGVSATANRKTHPKLPDYDLARLPRDPGTTTAFDFGVGVAKEQRGTRFGFDINYVPARSNTWANSDTVIFVAQNGQYIAPGGHTVDNEFHFANLRMATGVGHESSKGGWQLGLSVASNSYTLQQDNHVLLRTVRTQEDWTEWTPSWGLHHTFGDISLRYSGRLVMKGFPDLGTRTEFATTPVSGADSGQDFLVPITGPVFLPDYSIFTSQFSVSVAIGGSRR
ncbi:MAG: hypothetical protein ABIV28_01895 [Longimicrobiales bacterium]